MKRGPLWKLLYGLMESLSSRARIRVEPLWPPNGRPAYLGRHCVMPACTRYWDMWQHTTVSADERIAVE